MFVAKYSPQGAPIWVDQFFDTSDSFNFGVPTDFANGLAVDNSGNVYVTGSFTDGVTFAPNNTGNLHQVFPFNSFNGDVFVLKLGATGSFQDVQDWGDDTGAGTGFGEGTSIAIDPSGNNVLVMGDFTNTIDTDPNSGTFAGVLTSSFANVQDGFAVEVNSSLQFNWGVRLSSNIGFAAGITAGAFDPNNDNAYVGGFFGTDGSGDSDAIIGKISPVGNVAAIQLIGNQEQPENTGFQFDAVTGIEVDSQDNVYVTGEFAGKGVDFNDAGSTVALDSSDDGFVDDAFLAKYDQNFNLKWADRLGSGSSAEPVLSRGLAIDSGNDVYFGGLFTAPAAYGTSSTVPNVISPVPSGTFVVDSYALRVNATTGNLDSTGGTPDTFVAGSSSGNTAIFDFVGNASGEEAFAGFYDGNSDPSLGPITLSSMGSENAFIAELSAPLQPPVINSPAANSTISVSAEQSSTQPVSATDPQGLALTYSLSFATPSAAAWTSINPSTGLITFDPPATAANQNFTIMLTVTDSGVPPQSTTERLAIAVKPPAAPTINAPIPAPTPSLVGGQTFLSTIDVTGTDPAGNPIVWSLINSPPSWATIDSSTGVITLQPPSSVSGNVTLSIAATDSVSHEQTSAMETVSVASRPLRTSIQSRTRRSPAAKPQCSRSEPPARPAMRSVSPWSVRRRGRRSTSAPGSSRCNHPPASTALSS